LSDENVHHCFINRSDGRLHSGDIHKTKSINKHWITYRLWNRNLWSVDIMTVEQIILPIAGAAVMWLLNHFEKTRAKSIEKNTEVTQQNTLAIVKLETRLESINKSLNMVDKLSDDMSKAWSEIKSMKKQFDQ